MQRISFFVPLARCIIWLSIAFVFFNCHAPSLGMGKNDKLIFSDDFEKGFDSSRWIVEMAREPGSKVYVRDGKLVLDTKGGVTVWLNTKLRNSIRIKFTRSVLIDSGKNDRLSDLNMFWMASDPRNENLFTRQGVLESYDSLQLYYIGMGGNNNSTTRFRKYPGNGERTLLQEYKDAEHLLQANKEYDVAIEVKGNLVAVTVNRQSFFFYNDPFVLKEGYVGFRSTKSRQAIDQVRIYQLN